MNFIDNYGHVFSIPSYDKKPIGYEYEEFPYIFWVDSNNNNRLSINNYYIKVVNIVINGLTPPNFVEISTKSNVFKLLKSSQVNELISANKSSKDLISLSEDDDIKTTLSIDDLLFIPVEDNKLIVPLYIICNSSQEGSWYTNVLINFDNSEYCFITVGGVFIDECEPLIINGKNMGVDLPKDIIKAIYNNSYYNDEFNYRLYNEKVKEYLMNYIGIKGELGNFNSVENSIKWFGWSKYLSISKLLQNDNEYKNQFIRDYFELNTDVIESFSKFRNSTYISLTLELNKETGEEYEIDFNKEFWGEGKPKLESLLDKQIKVNNGFNNSIEYIKYYYDYTFNELGLKLWCLGYFLEKYFLPIHLSIHSIATNHNVFSNDIKFINKPKISITEPIINTCSNNVDIKFPKSNLYYFTHQIHYVDDNLNEFKYNKSLDELKLNKDIDLYYINDTCINIPIEFNTNINSDEQYYNCNLILEKKNREQKYFNIKFNNSPLIDIKSEIKLFNMNNEIISDGILYASSYDNNRYSEFFNDYNKLIKKIIYNSKDKNNISIDVKTERVLIETLLIKEEKKYIELYKYDNEEKGYIYQKHYLKNDEEMLYCSIDGISYDYYLIPPIDKIYHTYNKGITDKIDIHKIEKFYIGIKLNTNNVSKIKIGDNNLILFNDFLVISDNEYIKLFESNFAFIQTKDEKYNNFIIYPKIIGKNNQYNNLTGEISYWVNEEFRLSLFVNNKWYFHEFKTSIGEPNIKVGKLEYKYWNNDFNISSNFKQIRGFEKYGDREIVKFNAFAHEPDLFNVNNINFYHDYIKYCINNNLQYINKNYINNDDFYQIILLNNQKIRFHKSLYQRNFYFSSSLLNNENISSIYIYLYDEYITYVALESENDTSLVLLENSIDGEVYNNITNIPGILLESDINLDDIIENNKIEDTVVYCIYNHKSKNYNVYVNIENKTWDFGYPNGITPITVLHGSKSDIEEKYVRELNISKSNKQFFNNIHIFNIKRNLPNTSYLYANYKGDVINCKGINFVFNDYKYENGLSKIKVNIFGTINNESVYHDYEMLDEKSFIALLNEENNENINVSTLTDFNLISAHYFKRNDIENKSLYPYNYIYYYDQYNKIIIDNIYHIEYEPKYEKYSENIINKIDVYCTLDVFNLNDIKYNDNNDKDIISIEYIRKGKYIIDKYQLVNEEFNIYVSENNELVYIDKDKVLDKDIYNVCKIHFDADIYKFIEDSNRYIKIDSISAYDYNDFYNSITNGDTKYKLLFTIKKIPYNKVYNEQVYYFGFTDEEGKCGKLLYSEENDNYYECVKKNEEGLNINIHNLYGIIHKIYDEKNSSYKIVPVKYPGAHWWTCNGNEEDEKLIFEYMDNVNFIPLGLKEVYDRNKDLYNDFWLKNYFAYKLLDNLDNISRTSIKNKTDYEVIYKSKVYCENINIEFIPVVYIIRENGEEEYVYGNKISNEFIEGKIEFTIYPDDKLCYLFYQIQNAIDGNIIDNDSFIEITIEKKDHQRDKLSLYKYDLDDLNENEYISINVGNNEYKYGINISNEITKLYKDFFKEINYELLNLKIYEPHDELNLGMTLDYDFYLMHDNNYWYGVYISKDNISNVISDTQLECKKRNITFNVDDYTKYELEYVKSENKVLFNRLKFIDCNGINHFKDDDLIVMKLENNNRLPVNIFNGSKWQVNPVSFGIPKLEEQKSNSEMCILSLPMNDNKYYKGYYNVTVRYSLDRFTNQQFINETNILIK